MTAKLSRMVGEVRQGTEAIASASTQIAQGNGDLSARTEAKEIKGPITGSVEQVEQGNTLAGNAGQTLVDVVQQVGKVDQATQQNAALVEETAAAAESLSTQARNLADVVARFKLPVAQAAFTICRICPASIVRAFCSICGR
jgi:methyl-accepting chemotaxis protein